MCAGMTLRDEEFPVAKDEAGRDFDDVAFHLNPTLTRNLNLAQAEGLVRLRLRNRNLPPDALVNPTESFHLLGVEKVAAIEHNGMRKCFARAFEVQLFEFVPL